jgi:DNA-directed RNA polymerase specialized sigma24 family protein
MREGDSRAYKYLYERYYTLLCAIANEYLGDYSLSESTVGELIFHLWEKRETLKINTSLRNYLIRAIKNRCINVHEEKSMAANEKAFLNKKTGLMRNPLSPTPTISNA